MTDIPICPTVGAMKALPPRRRLAAPVLALGTLFGVLTTLIAAPANAATVAHWADWDELSGTAGAYTTAVRIADAPALSAIVTSDSRAGSGTGRISGASNWLSGDTPVGQKYGSSRNQPYLNLRPLADTATSPSTTTYTFSRATPVSGWTFVLGDIDADSVRISATGPGGAALTAYDLGFRGGFNYCAGDLTGKPSCTGDATDVPSWDPATLTLTGNAAAADTDGAAAWFEPTAPIETLTFSFTQRAGFPVYQTWFAALSRDITGSVTDAAGPVGGVELTLTDAGGTVIGTTATDATGAYAFPGIQATSGYTVTATPPSGRALDGPGQRPVDLTASDGVADFRIRDLAPVTVSGSVRDAEGMGIPGVTVTIPGVGDAVTGPDGAYQFPDVPAGQYAATLKGIPEGYTVTTAPPPFTIPAGSEAAVEDVDFVITLDAVGPVDPVDPESPDDGSTPPGGQRPGTGMLPATGADSTGPLTLAGLLLGAGAAVLALGRLRSARR